jgi:hypothetical protein
MIVTPATGLPAGVRRAHNDIDRRKAERDLPVPIEDLELRERTKPMAPQAP